MTKSSYSLPKQPKWMLDAKKGVVIATNVPASEFHAAHERFVSKERQQTVQSKWISIGNGTKSHVN
ncbi:MAG: hypothetical protein ACPHL6_05600 [Rubripirellula sp.]